MFVLNEEPAKPEWITLMPAKGRSPALRLLVKPPETSALIAGRQARREASTQGQEGADLDMAFVIGIARWAASDWQGVGDLKGKPIAFTADGVERLLRQSPLSYVEFDSAYVLPLLMRDAEKNVSSPSPAGTLARAAKGTAAGARRRSGAKPAPTKSTGRKRSSASGSGAS